jgi:cytochrome b561
MASATMMPQPIPVDRYTPVAIALHWTTAALVLFMIPAGLLMGALPEGKLQDLLFNLHRSCGVLIFPLVFIRLIYRWRNPPPTLPDDLHPLQKLAAHLTHYALYGLLLLNPLLGWWATSAYGATVNVFWLFDLPPLVGQNRPFSETLFLVHSVVGITIALLIAMHIAGALYHHFIRRDRILLRMLGR